MKKKLLPLLLMIATTCSVYGQSKVIKNTRQKTFGGIGGIFQIHTVGIDNSSSDSLVIDSVCTVSDKKSLHVSYNVTSRNYCEFVFSEPVSSPPKCGTCPNSPPDHFNLKKGIYIYYSIGQKHRRLKVKKFKDLPELKLP